MRIAADVDELYDVPEQYLPKNHQQSERLNIYFSLHDPPSLWSGAERHHESDKNYSYSPW